MANYDVTTAAAALEFATSSGRYNAAVAIDANHFIDFWEGVAGDSFTQVFEVSLSTWAVTTAAALLEFDTQNGGFNSAVKVDANHFLNFWEGDAGIDGYVQVFEVNTTTWAVSTAAAWLEFDTQRGQYHSAVVIDTNHFLLFWSGGATGNGFLQVFTVNTTTWAVTTAAASLEFETQGAAYNNAVKIDANHFINFFAGVGNDGFVQTYEVNTTTWAVSTVSTKLEFDTVAGLFSSAVVVDANHFINFWGGDANDGFVQVFTVNTTTWAVTTAAARLEHNATQGLRNSAVAIDANHFINFYSGSGNDGFTQTFVVNTTTWAVATASAVLLEFDGVLAQEMSSIQIDESHYMNFWAGNASDGFAQVFTVEIPAAVSADAGDLMLMGIG